jgi:hypothetical protein
MPHVDAARKTVELQGGRNAGVRLEVPFDVSEVGLAVQSQLGFTAVETYRCTGRAAPDGVEVWSPASAWGALAAMAEVEAR